MNNKGKKEYCEEYIKEKYENVIMLQKQGKIVIGREGDFGIPSYKSLPDTRLSKSATYEVGNAGKLDYDFSSAFYIYTPYPGAEQPDVIKNYRKTAIAEGEFDPGKEILTVKHQDELITFTDVQSSSDFSSVMAEANKQLASYGIVVWKINILDTNKVKSHLFAGKVTRISNSETSVLVSGYAIDESNHLVYVGMIGHKTSLLSLTSTLAQGKGVLISGHQYLYPLEKYMKTIVPMPEYQYHHCLCLATKAIPGQWVHGDSWIYIAQFQNGPSIKNQFIERLNEALVIPLIPDWRDELYQEGVNRGYIKELETAGDCLSCIAVYIEGEWNRLIEDLLTSDLITL